MRVVWTPLAIQRAAEIAAYIARDHPAAAVRWVDSLFERSTILSRFREVGSIVPEVGRSEIRELRHGSYRVIYRIEVRRVSILTVRHGRRLLDPTEVDPEP